MLRKARKRLADRDVISPQRRKDAEISAENTVGNGERWRERGVRFDAETRGRGGRRGEEGREKARASGVPRAVSGGSGEDGGKTSELRSDGQARRPILQRSDAECGWVSGENTFENGERWRERGVRFDAETRGRGGRRGEEGREKARASDVPRAVSGGSGEDGGKTSELRSDGQARRPILQHSDAECGWVSGENTFENGERWRQRGLRFDAETRRRGGRRGEEGGENKRDSGVSRAVSGGSGEDGGKTSELRSDGQARRPILQHSDAECGWVSGENTFENGGWCRERGVRFDAETRGRGGRRGEEGREKARDSGVPRAVSGGSGEDGGKTSELRSDGQARRPILQHSDAECGWVSGENTFENGGWWRERGVRFDAETRRRGERRGEEGREKARDSRVRRAVSGGSGERVERSLDTAGRSACATSLSGDGIPASSAKVVKGGAARRVVDQIFAAQRVEGQVHGLGEGDAESRTGLDEIRPILAFGVDGGVAVPVELHRTETVSGAGLRVEKEILIETADVERIQGGVGEPGASLAMQPARDRHAAAVIGRHVALQVADGAAGLAPGGDAVPGLGGRADGDDEGTFGEI